MTEKPPAGWYPDSTGTTRWWDGNQWTDHQPPPPPTHTADAPTPSPVLQATATPAQYPTSSTSDSTQPKKKRRVFLWFFLAVQVLFIIWIVAGASSGAGTPEDCGTLSKEACNAASDVGTSIGVALVVMVWVVVDFLLAVVYGIYRLAKR